MDLTAAARLGHLNLIEFCRHSATWGRTGAVQEHGGALLFACDTDFPVTMNGVFRTDGQTDAAAVTNAGFALGARVNTLQASPMGAPIYLRMGYQTVFDYRVYVRFVQ